MRYFNVWTQYKASVFIPDVNYHVCPEGLSGLETGETSIRANILSFLINMFINLCLKDILKTHYVEQRLSNLCT